MRNKKTNFLQIIVLFTGLFYIVIGLTFFISPAFFGNVLHLNVNSDWIANVHLDEFLFMLYTFSRIASFIMFTSGLAMILPLFDPLKYRGLVYCNGALFQLTASLYLLISGITKKYYVILTFGSILAIFFIFTLTALIITKTDAKHGYE